MIWGFSHYFWRATHIFPQDPSEPQKSPARTHRGNWRAVTEHLATIPLPVGWISDPPCMDPSTSRKKKPQNLRQNCMFNLVWCCFFLDPRKIQKIWKRKTFWYNSNIQYLSACLFCIFMGAGCCGSDFASFFARDPWETINKKRREQAPEQKSI